MFNKIKKFLFLPIAVMAVMISISYVHAEEPAISAINTNIADLTNGLNTVWVLVAAFLVFFMQAGFALVETGFTRAKNSVNIIMKNTMDFAFGSIAFFVTGYGIMFGADVAGLFGADGFMLSAASTATSAGMWHYAFWLFQCVFAATAATIVSGAMAERTKFSSYLIYSIVISAFLYPISGHWIWGGGWLATAGFIDFAGSTVVHSVGGWAAMAGAIMLGPRIGKYGKDGSSQVIAGHNIPLAALGVFILWFGWFGFNPGSTVSGMDLSIGVIAVTTNLSAAMAAITAMLTVWIKFGKPDLSMTLNGALGGLVGITAGCANVSPVSAIIIGAVSGVLVVYAVEFLDKTLKIDDPVGAVSVHGVCGAWGTLAVGLFAQEGFGGEVNGLLFGGGMSQLFVQLKGIVAVFIWSFVGALILFAIIKKTIGLRVSREEEIKGLDIEEHGMEAYGGFQIFTTEG